MKTKPARKSEADWLIHVIESSKTKSMTEYAKSNHIDVNQLYLWKSKLTKSGQFNSEKTTDTNHSLFEKVPVSKTFHAMQRCKIILPNQICIEFSSLNDLDGLSEFIARLGERL